jgi:hypothetical protein
MAFLAGLEFTPTPELKWALQIHYTPPGYYNFLGNHFTPAPPGNPARGIYSGIRWNPLPGWEVRGFIEYTDFQWIRYSARGLSSRRAAGARLIYRPTTMLDLSVSVRSNSALGNLKEQFSRIYRLAPHGSTTTELRASFRISDKFELRSMVKFSFVKDTEEDKTNGMVISQDIIYSPRSTFYSFFLRMALFETEGYDSRVYTYERDVSGAAAIPAYYDRGSRLVLMVRLKIFQVMDLWLRYGVYIYDDKMSIGTGVNEIRGNIKSDVRVQVRIGI